MKYAQPPPELAQAIAAAASRYRIPNGAALLTGIWREEAGSEFPNPYVNSSGYGGLFGTTDWNGSTQAQANLAASILAAGFQQSGGDVRGALSYYNTGHVDRPGGLAYANTVLSLAGVSGGGGRPRGGGTQPQQTPAPPYARTRPGAGSDGNQLASWWSWIPWTLGVGPSYLYNEWKSIVSTVKGGWDVLKAFVWLADPRTWLRITEALIGLWLFVLGLLGLAVALLVRSPAVGKIAGVASAAPGPIGAAGKAVTTVRAFGGRRGSSGSRRASTSGGGARRPPDELAAARARTESERTKDVRARRRQRLEQARELRREREKRESAAYRRGAEDVLKHQASRAGRRRAR